MKKFILGGLLATGMMFAGSGTAVAGEYTGNGGTTSARGHAASVCMFSGLDMQDVTNGGTEDNPPGFDDDAITRKPNPVKWRGVQNFGQFMSQGIPVSPEEHPGTACRGNLGR